MANINGTPGPDLIHMNGDGLTPGFGVTDIDTTTNLADTINAGFGDDIVYSYAGLDTIDGGFGNDTIYAGVDKDTVTGGEGNDAIHGGAGLDTLAGGAGYDTFYFDQISDISGLGEIIDGGDDIDTLDFATFGATGAVDISKAHISNVEALTIFNNTVTATALQLGAFTTISGNPFFTTETLILLAAGTVNLTDATIIGIDEFRGTLGNDKFVFTGVADGQTVNGLGGVDVISGGNGADILNGGDGADTISGDAGNDTIYGDRDRHAHRRRRRRHHRRRRGRGQSDGQRRH